MTTSRKPQRKAKAKPLTADQRKIKELDATIEKARDEYRSLQYKSQQISEQKAKTEAALTASQENLSEAFRNLSTLQFYVADAMGTLEAVEENLSDPVALQRVIGTTEGILQSAHQLNPRNRPKEGFDLKLMSIEDLKNNARRMGGF